jgi:hypothetical protein
VIHRVLAEEQFPRHAARLKADAGQDVIDSVSRDPVMLPKRRCAHAFALSDAS